MEISILKKKKNNNILFIIDILPVNTGILSLLFKKMDSTNKDITWGNEKNAELFNLDFRSFKDERNEKRNMFF